MGLCCQTDSYLPFRLHLSSSTLGTSAYAANEAYGFSLRFLFSSSRIPVPAAAAEMGAYAPQESSEEAPP